MVTIFGENLPVASNMAQSHPLLWCIEVWNLSTWQFIFKNIICGISEFLTNIIYDWFLDFRPGFILCCFQPRWVLVRDWLAASSWSHLHRPPPPIWTHLDISFGWMSLWPGWPDCFSPRFQLTALSGCLVSLEILKTSEVSATGQLSGFGWNFPGKKIILAFCYLLQLFKGKRTVIDIFWKL